VPLWSPRLCIALTIPRDTTSNVHYLDLQGRDAHASFEETKSEVSYHVSFLITGKEEANEWEECGISVRAHLADVVLDVRRLVSRHGTVCATREFVEPVSKLAR